MENNKTRLFKTIDNKRTISSQQGHYNYQRSQHQRKFTIEYCDVKKPLRQPLMQRKNQSLPKNLINNSLHNLNQNIRSRKYIYSSQSNYGDQKSSYKTIPTHITQSQNQNRTDITKSKQFNYAVQLFSENKYEQALSKFIQLNDKSQFSKIVYYIGVCYWKLGKNEKAIFNLSKAMDLNQQLSIQLYQFLSTFYEQTKNFNCALKTLDQWLKIQSSSKAYLMRARIYFMFKQYSKAIEDYIQCYRVEPTKLEAYIEQAEATYKIYGLNAAIQKYSQLLLNYNRIWPQSQHSDINYVKYKKSLLLILQKNYQQSLSLLSQVTNPQLQSQVNYYIGIIHSVLGQPEQATLSFNRSIQANTSDKFVGQSYYQKFILMFKKNDYYGIQYEMDIIRDRYGDNEGLEVLRLVIEGVVCILKMNFGEGLRIFDGLGQNQCYVKNSRIYSATISSFKIFAYYSLYKFQQAFEEFNNVKSKKMTDSNRYNYVMLKAIKASQSKDYNQSLKLFSEAQKVEPFNNHTFMLKAIVEILFYNSLVDQQKTSQHHQEFQNINQQILLSAEQLLNRCLLKQTQNDQLLYILASINYQLSQYESGLKLIRKAIDASDDHTIKHYYLKANLKLMLDMYSQAINDYTNAILVMNQQQNLNANSKKQDMEETQKQMPIYECYLERAKCYILDRSLDKAQADLRTFFSQLENVKKYEKELDLFMHVGCSDVILDIYKSILEEQYDPYNKMKCYYLAKQLNNCLNMMNIMLEFSRQEQSDQQKNYDIQKLCVDRDCLQALKKSSQGSTLLIQQALTIFQQKLQSHNFGEIFKRADCMFYAGVMCFHLQEYGKAKNYFIDAKSQKIQLNQISKNDADDQINLQNQLFSLQQINYNIGICDYVQGKWSTYLQQYSQFRKQHQSVTQNLLQQTQQITPFLVKNRLCSIYPPQKSGNLTFRLSFCLPKIKLRDVTFSKNQQIIKSISIRDIDMRPSAPWIQKTKKGIVFTAEILKESIDLKSERSKKDNNKKKAQERYKEQQQN